ncbi:hypothetical protein D3C75_1318140 [compost metagenome]
MSVTAVATGKRLVSTSSKLPPLWVAIAVTTLPPSMYGVFACTAKFAEPVMAPAAMLITTPLNRVTVMAVPAGLLRVAV